MNLLWAPFQQLERYSYILAVVFFHVFYAKHVILNTYKRLIMHTYLMFILLVRVYASKFKLHLL